MSYTWQLAKLEYMLAREFRRPTYQQDIEYMQRLRKEIVELRQAIKLQKVQPTL
jgi:hypothetical protein